jgi:hypothetical protein
VNTPIMTPHEVLVRAHALLRDVGWIQGTTRDKLGYCALAAITGADRVSAYLARAILARTIGCYSCKNAEDEIVKDQIVFWNDNPERTRRQVLAAFRRAIRLAEGGAP